LAATDAVGLRPEAPTAVDVERGSDRQERPPPKGRAQASLLAAVRATRVALVVPMGVFAIGDTLVRDGRNYANLNEKLVLVTAHGAFDAL
jgi:hypothetical protein